MDHRSAYTLNCSISDSFKFETMFISKYGESCTPLVRDVVVFLDTGSKTSDLTFRPTRLLQKEQINTKQIVL